MCFVNDCFLIFLKLNYRPIWKKALEKHASVLAKTAKVMPADRPVEKNVQIRLAVIMSLTVLEFNIFQLPLSILVLAIIYQTLTGMVTISHEFETVGIAFIIIDSIINPLWTAFISKKPKNNKTSPKNYTNNTINTINTNNSKTSNDCQSSLTTRCHGLDESVDKNSLSHWFSFYFLLLHKDIRHDKVREERK